MAKYKEGDKFISTTSGSNVKVEILFVAPIDGEGNQFYLEAVHSVYVNGGKEMFLHLNKEENIDNNLKKVN